MIDSDVIIYHLNGATAASQLLRHLFRNQPAISVITYMEVVEGLSDVDDDAATAFARLRPQLPVVVFAEAEAERTAQLRYALRQAEKPVRRRPIDLMIAGTALEHDLILVTNNPRDYADTMELNLYATKLP